MNTENNPSNNNQPAKKLRVRIKRCSGKKYWYAEKIGEPFDVYDAAIESEIFKNEYGLYENLTKERQVDKEYILKSDCTIIEPSSEQQGEGLKRKELYSFMPASILTYILLELDIQIENFKNENEILNKDRISHIKEVLGFYEVYYRQGPKVKALVEKYLNTPPTPSEPAEGGKGEKEAFYCYHRDQGFDKQCDRQCETCYYMNQNHDEQPAKPVKGEIHQQQANEVPLSEAWPILQALIRCALASSPTEATKHQINRLQQLFNKKGLNQYLEAIIQMQLPANESENFKIVRSGQANEVPEDVRTREAMLYEMLGELMYKYEHCFDWIEKETIKRKMEAVYCLLDINHDREQSTMEKIISFAKTLK